MLVRVFTIPFDGAVFDDASLVAFQNEGNEPTQFQSYLAHHDGQPVLVIVAAFARRQTTRIAPAEPDPPVPEGDRKLFEALRVWRNQRAERLGRPPYQLFVNRTLAAIAAARPSTATALGTIPRIGEARVTEHGAEILQLVVDHGPHG